jgi:hypothetical protein
MWNVNVLPVPQICVRFLSSGLLLDHVDMLVFCCYYYLFRSHILTANGEMILLSAFVAVFVPRWANLFLSLVHSPTKPTVNLTLFFLILFLGLHIWWLRLLLPLLGLPTDTVELRLTVSFGHL